ncbi:HAMP domain-containing protein [Starkeya sp. ORNL1]|uniref:ATP-binding protein n=1 Tax=Starkeya sp. ORNL1 TaxID=2709380 RepID=UPI0014639E73|nr:ATP-binding protein [Starkeya sp. ORNL1]QJP17804.1 HAMP domain-containing protein [Starkeya sp. ORNL1]
MRWFYAASIRTQLFALATVLGATVSIIAAFTEPFIHGRYDRGVEIGLIAGRIEMVLDQFRRARSSAEEDVVLETAVKIGAPAERISPQQLLAQHDGGQASSDVVGKVRALLDCNALTAIERTFNGQTVPGILVLKIDTDRALAFNMPVFPHSLRLARSVAGRILNIAIPCLLLAYFSSYFIIRPLIRFTSAVKQASMNDNTAEPFEAVGASEIRSLAESLNVMRNRIQQMVEDRTRMLSAVGHDLRTPLTRLRLRAERSTEPDLRNLMLADISTLGSMIDESMAFLTNASIEETARKVDLSSLLQTIATDFSDTGVNVSFKGPRRLTHVCRPQAITRAVSNLVENASRYAPEIEIELQSATDCGVLIRVSDNGPGLTEKLKARVVEPFFKADEARTSEAHSGFGLGLSIAQGIVQKGHKGTLSLRDRTPNGLIVEIKLPPIDADEADGMPALQ